MGDEAIQFDPEQLRRYCVEQGIRRIRVYGSATRTDFDPTRSDIDVLVDFVPGRTPGFRFFELGAGLSRILGRPVDVSTERMLSRHFRDEVVWQVRVLYDAA